ncbi:MAG: DUF2931 family protein [Niabella sp.]
MDVKFKWQEATSAPLGYPVDVLRGGLEAADGDFTGLIRGTTVGAWGQANQGMSDGMKTIPFRLHVIWLSYAEDCFYEVDTSLDYFKIAALFKKGYYVPSIDPDRPGPFKEDYNQINVGFAPGGYVTVWVGGVSRQIKVGTATGKKVVIPQEVISGLDYPLKNLFDEKYKKETMLNDRIVPKEVQEYNKGKKIPFGKWEKFNRRYNWNVEIKLPGNEAVSSTDFSFMNGEHEQLFGASLEKKYQIDNDFCLNTPKERAVPEILAFYYNDSTGQEHAISVFFNETETLDAFCEVFDKGHASDATIVVDVNQLRTGASVSMVTPDKKTIWLTDCKVKGR